MKTKFSLLSSVLLMLLTTIFLTTGKVNATSLTYNLTTDTGCKSLINGALSATATVTLGTNSDLTLTNNDLVVAQHVDGPGIPPNTTIYPNTKTGPANSQTLPLTDSTGQEIITFTPIPSADSSAGVNYCPISSNPTPVSSALTITFVAAPATTPTATSPKSPTSATSQTSASSTTSTTSVQLTNVVVNGKEVPIDKAFEAKANESIKLTGQTTANGLVTLTIHSTPTTTTTTADASGKWSYVIPSLQPGDHYVEATVTNPTSKQVSSVVKLVSFTVTAVPTPVTTTPPAKPKTHTLWLVIVGLALAIVLIVVGGLLIRKRKAKKPPVVAPANEPSVVTPPVANNAGAVIEPQPSVPPNDTPPPNDQTVPPPSV